MEKFREPELRNPWDDLGLCHGGSPSHSDGDTKTKMIHSVPSLAVGGGGGGLSTLLVC